jgi:hypothetical protein
MRTQVAADDAVDELRVNGAAVIGAEEVGVRRGKLGAGREVSLQEAF